jgi:hypothetical protein
MQNDEKLNKALENLVIESRVPKVGIWWFIDDQVYSFEEEFRLVEPVGGYRDGKYAHAQEWRRLQIPGEYTDYERGRVTMDNNDKVFKIICSNTLAQNKIALAKIARHFSLPLSRLKIETDLHYTVNPSQEELDDLFAD